MDFLKQSLNLDEGQFDFAQTILTVIINCMHVVYSKYTNFTDTKSY